MVAFFSACLLYAQHGIYSAVWLMVDCCNVRLRLFFFLWESELYFSQLHFAWKLFRAWQDSSCTSKRASERVGWYCYVVCCYVLDNRSTPSMWWEWNINYVAVNVFVKLFTTVTRPAGQSGGQSGCLVGIALFINATPPIFIMHSRAWTVVSWCSFVTALKF